ncbi:MAG TPA: potassium channel protein [Dehalococcoidia bacterium]|nr:potassium channel protein [Dehalococcoidia bacterium]
MKEYRAAAQAYGRVLVGLLALGVILVFATGGYMIIEGWSFLDALYMTVITLTTVGYREVQPLSRTGMAFTMVVLFVGVGTSFYILTALVSTIIEGDLRQLFGERRMKIQVEHLKDHHIICGFGRVGEEIALEFKQRQAPFVVVDLSAEALERARAEGYLVLQGDATQEETLKRAGIERCASLIAALDSDAGNTYITLTAKMLRPDVRVVARVASASNEKKLLQAGADHIVSPYQMGGRRLALSALQPILLDFMDIVSLGSQGPGVLGEFGVDKDSGLQGRTIGEVCASAPDLVVLAVRSERGTFIVGPAPSTRLALGDRLMVFGPEEQLRRVGPPTGVTTAGG